MTSTPARAYPGLTPGRATPRSVLRATPHTLVNATPGRALVERLPPLIAPAHPPAPYASDASFVDMLDRDREAIEQAVALFSAKLSARKKAVTHALAEIEEERRRLEDESREYGERAKEMARTLQTEREQLEEAKRRESDAIHTGQTLRARVETLKADLAEVDAKLNVLREANRRQQRAFEDELRKATAESAFLEQALGLRIRGRGHDVVEFAFTHVDPHSHSRIFAFTLDASTETYKAHVTAPTASFLSQDVLKPLVRDLNTSRNLYAFIGNMRRAFQAAVA